MACAGYNRVSSDVRYGSLGEMAACLVDVRFGSKADLDTQVSMSALPPKATSLDHLVSARRRLFGRLMPSALARLAEREPQALAALLEVNAERIERGKLDDALRELGLDRSINVDRKSHAIDHAGLDDRHRAFERALNALFLDRMWR